MRNNRVYHRIRQVVVLHERPLHTKVYVRCELKNRTFWNGGEDLREATHRTENEASIRAGRL